jgi:CBS domain-containing protein
MFTRGALLEALPPPQGTAFASVYDVNAMLDPDTTTVQAIMTKEVHSLALATPMHEALKELFDRDVSGMPVLDEERRPMGVLSSRDVLRAVRPHDPVHAGDAPTVFYDNLDLGQVREVLRDIDMEAIGSTVEGTVEPHMTAHVISCSLDTSVREAARIMAGRGIHRLLVVDAAGALAGLVSALDVVTYVAR